MIQKEKRDRSPRLLRLALAAALAGVLVGCSPTQVVEIISDPPGATVFVNGDSKGVTNTKVVLEYGSDPSQRVAVQVMKANYKPLPVQYWKRMEVPARWEVTLEQE